MNMNNTIPTVIRAPLLAGLNIPNIANTVSEEKKKDAIVLYQSKGRQLKIHVHVHVHVHAHKYDKILENHTCGT